MKVSDIYRPDLDSNIGTMSTVFFFDECVSEHLREEVVSILLKLRGCEVIVMVKGLCVNIPD